MENSNEEALFRGRSSRSCVRKGCQLYLSNFRRLLKASWIPAVLFAVCYGVIGTIAVIQFPRLNLNAFVSPETAYNLLDDYIAVAIASLLALVLGGLMEIVTYSCSFCLLDEHRRNGNMANSTRCFQIDRSWAWRALKGFVSAGVVLFVISVVIYCLCSILGLARGKMRVQAIVTPNAIVALTSLLTLVVALPLYYVLTKYMLEEKQHFWTSLLANYRRGIRHWGMLFISLVMTTIILLIASIVLLLPAIVVALANFNANLGVLFGDPLGMPSYIVPLTAVVMAFAGYVEVLLRSGFHFIGYYCYGSIDTQEEEKKQFNQEIQNI